MMEQKTTNVKSEEVAGRSLIDLIFSWSIRDVLNIDMYQTQVNLHVYHSYMLHLSFSNSSYIYTVMRVIYYIRAIYLGFH